MTLFTDGRVMVYIGSDIDALQFCQITWYSRNLSTFNDKRGQPRLPHYWRRNPSNRNVSIALHIVCQMRTTNIDANFHEKTTIALVLKSLSERIRQAYHRASSLSLTKLVSCFLSNPSPHFHVSLLISLVAVTLYCWSLQMVLLSINLQTVMFHC